MIANVTEFAAAAGVLRPLAGGAATGGLADTVVPVSEERVHRAKRSYASRRIDLDRAPMLITDGVSPRAGDLLLARVDRIGQHARIELPNGRRAHLYAGDEVLVCYGARYASDQFEALVPDDLAPCCLVAAGGIAARCLIKHERMKRPTEITPIGLVADAQGQPLNLADFGLPRRPRGSARPFVVAVLGTAMNAGKTTTAANLVRGMMVCGLRAAAVKVTGTGAGGDRWAMADAGASPVLDFTDCGHPSTYRLPLSELETIANTLVWEAAASGVDAVVVEVADGLLFADTAALVCSPSFGALLDGVVVAAGDAMGAAAALSWLETRRIPVLAVSGVLTASPLASRESRQAVSVPVIDGETMRSGAWLPQDGISAERPLSW